MFQQRIDDRRDEQRVVDLLQHHLHDEGRTVEGVVEDELAAAFQPFDVDRPDGGHIHERPGGNEVVAREDRGALEAELREKQPVVVTERAALGLGLGAGRPAEGKNIVGIDTDFIKPAGDLAFRHLLDIRQSQDVLDRRMLGLNLLGHFLVFEAAERLHGNDGDRLGHPGDEFILRRPPLHRHR